MACSHGTTSNLDAHRQVTCLVVVWEAVTMRLGAPNECEEFYVGFGRVGLASTVGAPGQPKPEASVRTGCSDPTVGRFGCRIDSCGFGAGCLCWNSGRRGPLSQCYRPDLDEQPVHNGQLRPYARHGVGPGLLGHHSLCHSKGHRHVQRLPQQREPGHHSPVEFGWHVHRRLRLLEPTRGNLHADGLLQRRFQFRGKH